MHVATSHMASMDKEKAKKLNRLIWKERVRLAILPGLIVSVLIGLLTLYLYDEQTAQRSSVQATVESWSRAQSYTGSSDYIIDVRLAGGTRATATAGSYGKAPTPGDRIQLIMLKTQSGRLSYRWDRRANGKHQQ